MTASTERFDVGGVLLEQPFKIRRLGHFGFNLSNMEDGAQFYIDLLGFRIWPARLDGDGNVYLGEPYLGPWG